MSSKLLKYGDSVLAAIDTKLTKMLLMVKVANKKAFIDVCVIVDNRIGCI